MSSVNPYNYNLPVEREMFYGRRKDIEQLTKGLLIALGDSYALIGGRRMGKTSLLEALVREMNCGYSGSQYLVIPVFIDLSGEMVNSTGDLFQRICNDIYLYLKEFVEVAPIALDNNQPPAPYIENELLHWNLDVLEKAQRGLRIVLLIDECEQVIDKPWATGFYGSLRHLLVSQKTRSILKVVMAGSHRFLTSVRQQGSPLRNILKYHHLKVLDPRELSQLISEPTNGLLNKDAKSQIENLCGGHPFLAQYLLHNAWEKGISTVTALDVNKIAGAFSHSRGDFQDWLDSIGPLGSTLYETLGNTETPLSEAGFREKHPNFTVMHLLALEALCYHGLVMEVEDGYRVAGSMFKHWFYAFNRASANEPRAQIIPESKNENLTLLIQGDYINGNKEVETDQRGQNVAGEQVMIGRATNVRNYEDQSIHAGRIDQMTHQEKVIKIGNNNTITAPLVIADTIENSFNSLQDAQVGEDVRSLLEELLKAITALNQTTPPEKSAAAASMARDVETLIKEASSDNPRRQWYEVSLEGLKQAAINIGELATPVLNIVTKLATLLLTAT